MITSHTPIVDKLRENIGVQLVVMVMSMKRKKKKHFRTKLFRVSIFFLLLIGHIRVFLAKHLLKPTILDITQLVKSFSLANQNRIVYTLYKGI